jgi:proteic killer suppression protein
LKRFYEGGDSSKLNADQRGRIEDALGRLDVAESPGDLGLPGYRLHPLKGEWKTFWSINVSGNRRIIFRFEAGDVYDVDLIDYH